MKSWIIYFRSLFILWGVNWKNEYFLKDLIRWKQIYHLNTSKRKVFAWLMYYKPEFRNLFIYRNSNRPIYVMFIKLFYKPMDTLFIESFEIGGGLFIQHGFSTMISAKSIGENCWINQQVTIGYNGSGNPPTIGNGVMITCGAKVLGDIYIGDNSVIGANAVVVKNVDADSVMVGIPAKKIERKSQ